MCTIRRLINHQIDKWPCIIHSGFTSSDVDANFVPGTFGYEETYNTLSQSFYINYLQDDVSVYVGTPYLFISAGSGSGPGFMYLECILKN